MYQSASRIISAISLLLLLTLMFPLSLHAASAIGRVAVLQGEARSIFTDGTARSLQLRSEVFMNDSITTGEKSRLQIIFSDKTTLTLGPSSTIVIDKYVYQADKSAGEFAATATKGFFRMITGNISRFFPDKVKVKTPAATIGIRGCLLAWSVGTGEQPLALLYLGGLQGLERGIYAENGAGMSELFDPEHGVRVPTPGSPPSLPTRWSEDQMRALLGPTVLHLPPSGTSQGPSDEPDFTFEADIDAPDELDFDVDPDVEREDGRARGSDQSFGNDYLN
ncbi:MAG: FecR domain-containing protein [Candidatus Sedimenticola sp. (ex Thyasira tokunagai)]